MTTAKTSANALPTYEDMLCEDVADAIRGCKSS